MRKTFTQDTLLCLISHAIGCPKPLPDDIYDVDWDKVIRDAARNGVAQLAFSGYVKSGLNNDPDCKLNSREMRRLKLTWMGLEIPQRKKYQQQLAVLRKLTKFYEKHGIEVQVLKGYPLSLCYPDPELRTASDIDIYCGKDYKRSNELIEQTGIKIDYSEHKHSTFMIDGLPIENHHSFLNVHGHKSSAEIERELEEHLPWDEAHTLLYLLRHSAENFTASQATLRQVIDCGLYASKHRSKIDWQWLTDIMERTGMRAYFDVVSAICVENLGFDISLFPEYCIAPDMLQRSLNDIITPEFSDEHPANIFSEMCYKLRRWRSNTWKHRIVYANETLAGTFLTQLWSHLLKPSSIAFGMK